MSESARKVLIVDPDASVRREIRAACEQDGFQVLEADSSAETIRQVEQSRPNLILLEATLPDGSGFDVCRELRKLDPLGPVVMMSTRSEEIDVAAAPELGAGNYAGRRLRIRGLAA